MPKNDPIGQSDFDDLVSKFVMNTMVPFLVVNDASFKPTFKSLQVAYQIPCFKQLRTRKQRTRYGGKNNYYKYHQSVPRF